MSSDLCPCIYPDVDPADPDVCACGHAPDEHDGHGQCQVPVDTTVADTAFDFARSLCDPAVRDRLREFDFDASQGDVILPFLDRESWHEVCARIPDDARRALLVAQDAHWPGGWSMRWATKDGEAG